MITLGIETSCDETALALIETRNHSNGVATHSSDGGFECRVIASLVHSQAELHSAYGGVYPALAKREHGKNLVPLLHKLLIESQALMPASNSKLPTSNFTATLESFRAEINSQNPDLFESFTSADFIRQIPKIDRIAVTEGPGLEPTLWVGINFARILSALWNIPVVPVNHMEGHVVGSLLESDKTSGSWQKLKPVSFPALALLISGGHTELVRLLTNDNARAGHSFGYKILGQSKDDAVGEAYDKVARLLGLPYPGGPHISKLSHEAEMEKIPSPVKLPRPMQKSGNLDFSFSGLKTAVLYAIRDHAGRDHTDTTGALSQSFKKGLAHEFELAVAETLETKLRAAIEETDAKTLIIGGGVSANRRLRERFEKIAAEYAIPLYLPSHHISGDNALMIALAGARGHKTASTAPLKAHGTKRLDA
jgi:N6-L-threonylcarbamoyladenine synthase